jgi:ParB-like chromosome segregation protein Spo0J
MKITFPCMQVRMVPREMVVANSYNPNHVPKDKMELLRQSILDNGFCFPIVTIWDADQDKYVIVDGFHRFTICQPQWLDIPEIPIVVLDHGIQQRMAATVQFNKARGVHQVDLDAEVIRALIEQGMAEDEISVHLGIDLDTIHRYKQLTGIADLFRNTEYSKAWEMEEIA